MPIQNISRKKVKDLVYEQLHKLILSGEWTAGQKIPSENALAEQMGVSRISIRSALQQLSSLGLIESRQGEGTFVCEVIGPQQMRSLIPMAVLTPDCQEQMNEFRSILECASAELASRRRTEKDLKRLKENYAAYLAAVRSGCDSTVGLDLDFHMAVTDAAGNLFLSQSILILKDSLLQNIQACKHLLGEDVAIRCHREIIEAIEARDAARAGEAMRKHLRANAEALGATP